MKINFKIYNLDIIDCSSCSNSIFPDPESQEILLEILLRICESDVVTIIGQFSASINNIELQSPKVIGTESFEYAGKDYILHMSDTDKLNKIMGCYVEPYDIFQNRINDPRYKSSTKFHYIEPGLEGIRKVVSYIRMLSKNRKEKLPEYLKTIKLKKFKFSIGVIWGMNRGWYEEDDGTFNSIDYINTIAGECGLSGCSLGFGNFGGDSWEIFRAEYYLKHLNMITKIMDEIAPDKYMAGPEDLPNLLEYGVIKKEKRELKPVEEDDDFNEKVKNYDNFKSDNSPANRYSRYLKEIEERDYRDEFY
ncbi:MAG: hypothetical protein HWN79_16155 [Candidatus Lokiarchaeota archaeon]|nr:hypothetical protein [Candidatus Lokiarchaeota archaeon]